MTTETRGRILVLFGSIPLYGHERGNIEAMEALRGEGWDVLFVTNTEWGHLHVEPELAARGFAYEKAIYSKRFQRGMGLSGWLDRLKGIGVGSVQLRRICRRYRPTHIHFGNVAWFINFLPALVMFRIPLIFRLGDSPSSHRSIFRFLWRRVLSARVSRFVCISRFVQARLVELGVPAAKTQVLYSRPPRRVGLQQRRAPMPKCGRATFGYLGQITEEKGVGLLVGAAISVCRSTDGVRFLFAGDYSWRNPFADHLIARLGALNLGHLISFLGYVDDIDLFFASIDVHVCPSICPEALGNTVLEAKARGVGSIVFPSGGLVEIVRDGIDGVVCKEKSVDAIERAVWFYLERPEQIGIHGKAALESLRALGVHEFARQWSQIYESTLRTG